MGLATMHQLAESYHIGNASSMNEQAIRFDKTPPFREGIAIQRAEADSKSRLRTRALAVGDANYLFSVHRLGAHVQVRCGAVASDRRRRSGFEVIFRWQEIW
jgi:hypothetical protein